MGYVVIYFAILSLPHTHTYISSIYVTPLTMLCVNLIDGMLLHLLLHIYVMWIWLVHIIILYIMPYDNILMLQTIHSKLFLQSMIQHVKFIYIEQKTMKSRTHTQVHMNEIEFHKIYATRFMQYYLHWFPFDIVLKWEHPIHLQL